MYYHVSRNDLGISVIFTPKVPSSAIIEREGNIPRICVSSHIVLCLKAIIGNKQPTVDDILQEYNISKFPIAEGTFISPTIYSTTDIPYRIPHASDFRENKEHWFLNDTTFNRVGYICLKSLILFDKLVILNKPMQFNYTEFLFYMTTLDKRKRLRLRLNKKIIYNTHLTN